MKNKYLSGLCVFFLSIAATSCAQPPRLTAIIAIDQLAYPFIEKLKDHLKGGIKYLLENGVQYSNAYYPHASPTTAVGYTALNTGTFAKEHGITGNAWFDETGKRVYPFDDSSSAVFAKDGKHSFGRSAKNIQSKTVSDQFVEQNSGNVVYAISLKDRAAIPAAGKRGKAIWFDTHTGYFTSSTAYFKQLPSWLTAFNQQENISKLTAVQWNLFYPKNHQAYAFPFIDNYDYASHPPLAGKTTPLKITSKKPFDLFCWTPQADQALFKLVHTCVENTLPKNPADRMMLWVLPSALDKIGHRVGPYAREVIDIIYHIDNELMKLISYLENKVGKENILFVLTGDHGVCPIPELLEKEGKEAHRPDVKKLMNEMNAMVQQKYGMQNFIQNFEPPQFYFDPNQKRNLDKDKIEDICTMLEEFLEKQPGIKHVWSNHDLDERKFKKNSIGSYFKNQRYPGRSGDLFVQIEKNTVFSMYPKGTTHESPYKYDRHIPLAVYQAGKFEKKKIRKKVSTLQLANTLAEILGIPKLPKGETKLLPGLKLH